MKNHILILIISTLIFSSCMNEPVMEPNTREGNFNALWKIIDTKYCFLVEKNVDWNAIKIAYKAQLDIDTTEMGFFDLMGRMLAELKDGHVNLYSDFDRTHYWKWYTDYPSNFSSKIIYGPTYLGENYRSIGGMQYARIHNDSIGYIYYGSFSDSFTSANMSNILNYFKDCTGLIIDVRNNGGGSIDYSKQMASYFFTKETVTGYIQHKKGPGHTDFANPIEIKTPASTSVRWSKPVAVLSNRLSYSATNDFVNRMKLAPKAVIVGDRTGGGGGFPLSSELPNGWMVRFSSSPMFDADMQQTEGGIEPDYKVEMDTTDKVFDAIVEKAVTLVK